MEGIFFLASKKISSAVGCVCDRLMMSNTRSLCFDTLTPSFKIGMILILNYMILLSGAVVNSFFKKILRVLGLDPEQKRE